ncbi:MAG: CAP domain-containing protein [Pyrinomonadaceae bacterium]|jgi:uncharacterized protein YkwD|nr:CAP domain-containing protein [Pyrinomonadaceae bacterium]
MKPLSISASLLVCHILVGALNTCAQSEEEIEIFELVNRERIKARLQPLEWDDRASNVARNYSRQMAREGFFGHYDRQGLTVIERASKLKWSKIGENLFMGDQISNFGSFAVKGWMRSTTHRFNILDREWNTTGIGVHHSNNGLVYVTQVFLSK